MTSKPFFTIMLAFTELHNVSFKRTPTKKPALSCVTNTLSLNPLSDGLTHPFFTVKQMQFRGASCGLASFAVDLCQDQILSPAKPNTPPYLLGKAVEILTAQFNVASSGDLSKVTRASSASGLQHISL